MTQKKPKDQPIEDTETGTNESLKLKTCFVIMPIADHPDYESGHFDRVYEYLIKPACLNAGYQAIRADDTKASNMIMFDILKQIVDSDMAICDLSSRNANVFYELGLRQAFNKKTILITDNKQPTPFDISSFRYVSYSPSLRVDTIHKEIPEISLMLEKTESASSDDLNSIVKLLQIRPAKVDPINLNQEDSVIYNMLMQIQNQVTRLSSSKSAPSGFINPNIISSKNFLQKSTKLPSLRLDFILSLNPVSLNSFRFKYEDKEIGKLLSYNDKELTFIDNQAVTVFPNTPDIRFKIESIESDTSTI